MNIGSHMVVMHIDDAAKLLAAARMDWDREKIKRLQSRGLFEVVDRLRDLVRDYERRNP